MISFDADVNAEDSLGKTPLDFAEIKKKLVYSSNKDIKLATFDHGIASIEESWAGNEASI